MTTLANKSRPVAGSTIQLSGPVSLAAWDASDGQDGAESPAKGPGRFTMLGYSGAVVTWCGWRFVIRLSGIRAKDSMPILREHQRDRIVGWSEGWTVDGQGLHVTGRFTDVTDDGQEAAALLADGFPWECSINVEAGRVTELKAGETDTVNGQEVTGPLDIWELAEVREVSFVSLGADKNTGVAAMSATPTTEDGMGEELKAAIGLPDDVTDEGRPAAQHAAELGQNPDGKTGAGEQATPAAADRAAPGKDAGHDTARAADLAERKRCADIDRLVLGMGLDAALARKLRDEGTPFERATDVVLAEAEKRNPRLAVPGAELAEGVSEADKFRSMASQGLMLQLGWKPGEGERVLSGAEQFAHMGPQGMARLCLERGGTNSRFLSAKEVADAILKPAARLAHSTSDFPAVFLDVANKTLLRAYDVVRQTWRPWVNIITATDFKDMYGIQLSGGPELLEVKENDEYKNGSLSESAEKFRVSKWGRIITLSWEMLVNDDLNAFARLPRMFGAMAGRKYADVVYGLLLSNPKMSDGKQVFSSAHGNVGTGAKLDTDSLDAAYLQMTTQTGPNGEVLDIQPRYLLIPPSLRTTAMIILNSTALPQAQMSQGVYNPWQDSDLVPVVEPRLEPRDASAPKPWYLLADPTMANTVDVAFLDGREAPEVFEHDDFRVDALSYKVRAVMGAGWTDYRGAYQNPGRV